MSAFYGRDMEPNVWLPVCRCPASSPLRRCSVFFTSALAQVHNPKVAPNRIEEARSSSVWPYFLLRQASNALACSFCSMMDEPTNDLDLQTIEVRHSYHSFYSNFCL